MLDHFGENFCFANSGDLEPLQTQSAFGQIQVKLCWVKLWVKTVKIFFFWQITQNQQMSILTSNVKNKLNSGYKLGDSQGHLSWKQTGSDMTSKGCKKTTCKLRYKLATRKVEPKHYHKCMQNTQISAGWTVPVWRLRKCLCFWERRAEHQLNVIRLFWPDLDWVMSRHSLCSPLGFLKCLSVNDLRHCGIFCLFIFLVPLQFDREREIL